MRNTISFTLVTVGALGLVAAILFASAALLGASLLAVVLGVGALA